MKFLIIIVSWGICSIAFAIDTPSSQCSQFNSIALQFALAQDNMQPPLNLEQLQNTLGRNKPNSTIVTTTYTWAYKDLALTAIVTNNNITKKFLIGNGNESLTAKNIKQAYEKLKTATSIWAIKEIQSQLGPGNVKSEITQNYSWCCGIGSLEIIADQQNNITAATFSYKTNQSKEIIETQLGFNHPMWDIAIDSFNEHYRAWKRKF